MFPRIEMLKRFTTLALSWQWVIGGIDCGGSQTVSATNATHWAFQPLARPSVPVTRHTNPIDAFVSSALAKNGRELAVEADHRTLIRRLSF
jgi:hypothetical protein